MKEKKIRNLSYYKKEMMTGFIVLGGVLGFIGSYQYFSGILSGYRLWLACVFSTIKLFFFVPVLAVDADYTIVYEIAKWTAPIGTLLGLFSIFGNFFYSIRQALRSVGARNYIVFGGKDEAVKLLGNILKEDRKSQGYLVRPRSGEAGAQTDLLKRGIRVMELDFDKDPASFILGRLRDMNLRKSAGIIFFDEDLKNYKNLKSLLPHLDGGEKAGPIVVKYESEDLKNIMENDESIRQQADIKFFNPEKAMANEMLDRCFDFDDPKRDEEQEGGGELERAARVRDIFALFPKLHILLVGFGRLGRAVFLESLNQLVVSPDEKIRFTIVDKRADALYREFCGEYRNIDRMAETELIESNILHQEALMRIEEIDAVHRINLLVFSLEDYKNSVIALNRLKHILPRRAVALRVHENSFTPNFSESLRGYCSRIVFFGSDEKVFCRSFVLEEDIREKAMEFNASYNEKAAQLMDQEGPALDRRGQWNILSHIRRESCIYQIYHRNTKIKMLKYLIGKGLEGPKPEDLLDRWESRLQGKKVQEQIEIIKRDPLMSFFSALEHRRWCNFYYRKNFKYGREKNEAALVHNCLVPDWEEFLGMKESDTLIYDFISVLNARE